MNKWQRDWPTETGMYWFYGWCYHKFGDEPNEPEMYLVKVRKFGSGGMAYIEGGRFIYKEEGAEGMWLKAELPEPPKEVKAR